MAGSAAYLPWPSRELRSVCRPAAGRSHGAAATLQRPNPSPVLPRHAEPPAGAGQPSAQCRNAVSKFTDGEPGHAADCTGALWRDGAGA